MSDIIISKTTPSNVIAEKGEIISIENKNTYIGVDKTSAGWSKNQSADKKHKGFKRGEIPQDIWLMGIQMSGDKDYWKRDDLKNYKKFWKAHPEWEF